MKKSLGRLTIEFCTFSGSKEYQKTQFQYVCQIFLHDLLIWGSFPLIMRICCITCLLQIFNVLFAQFGCFFGGVFCIFVFILGSFCLCFQFVWGGFVVLFLLLLLFWFFSFFVFRNNFSQSAYTFSYGDSLFHLTCFVLECELIRHFCQAWLLSCTIKHLLDQVQEQYSHTLFKVKRIIFSWARTLLILVSGS